jgi:hypothetical protein
VGDVGDGVAGVANAVGDVGGGVAGVANAVGDVGADDVAGVLPNGLSSTTSTTIIILLIILFYCMCKVKNLAIKKNYS